MSPRLRRGRRRCWLEPECNFSDDPPRSSTTRSVSFRAATLASMARYWWQCISCGERPAWLTVCHSRSIAAFIWDELAPSDWDQRLLRRRCTCGRRSLCITYRLQRGDPERVSVRHIVGLGPDGDYLSMLWETFRHSSPRTRWIDFKYQRGRSPWGLNKRLVLEKTRFTRLLRAYAHATGQVGGHVT
jgi:hypothetical protein